MVILIIAFQIIIYETNISNSLNMDEISTFYIFFNLIFIFFNAFA